MKVKKSISQLAYDANYSHLPCQLTIDGKCEIQYEYELTYEKKRSRILNGFFKRYPNAMMYDGIAEQGYENQPTILTNWNTVYGKWREIIRSFDINVEFEDEWSTCDNCNKLIRTVPDSYDWEPYYVWISNYDRICLDCIKKDNSLLEEAILFYNKNSLYCFTSSLFRYLKNSGFKEVDETIYETGLHPGQDSNPEEELKNIKDDFDQIIFVGYDKSQFTFQWFMMYRNLK